MLDLFLLWFGALIRLLRSRRELALEYLALRQQLGVLKLRYPRLNLGTFDMLFWVVARRVWFGWKQSLIIVMPETVIPADTELVFVCIGGVARQNCATALNPVFLTMLHATV